MNPKRNQVGPNFFRQTIQIPSTAVAAGQSAWFNTGDNPCQNFSLQVSLLDVNGNFIPAPTGGPTWDVFLSGSLDGQSPTAILEHSDTGGGSNVNGETVSSLNMPWDYLLISWKTLAWGNAATIQIIVLGTPGVNLKG